MSTASQPLLVAILRQPSGALSLPNDGWALLIQQARSAQLLSRLAYLLEGTGDLQRVPAGPLHHLESSLVLARSHDRAVRWEVASIHDALRSAGIPTVLLKGAAYVMAELPTARGRWFSDIDIMVPRRALADAETTLRGAGWTGTHADDPYDQRFYREWMHEIPPMVHERRKTTLDVHHSIVPLTSRLEPDADKLFAAAVPLRGHPGLHVLSPPDMVLHSATHLFYEGEFHHGLRDLIDIDDLLRHFSAQDSRFWRVLVDRAFAMDLARPLFYALRYARRLLGTPLPGHVIAELRPARPNLLLLPLLDASFQRALLPDHPSCADVFTPVARWLLFLRGHYLRMPLRLLIPHLTRKAWRRVKGEEPH